jgi:GAF domain
MIEIFANALEAAVIAVSTLLGNTKDVLLVVPTILPVLGQAMRADTAAFFIVQPQANGRIILQPRFTWSNTNAEIGWQTESVALFDKEESADFHMDLVNGDMVFQSIKEGKTSDVMLWRKGAFSAVILPIFGLEKNLYGLLYFDHSTDEWSPSSLCFLHQTLGILLRRVQSRLLQSWRLLAQQRVMAFEENIPSPVASLDHYLLLMLEQARKSINMQVALISQVEADFYTVLHFAPEDAALFQGKGFALKNTFCKITFETQHVFAVSHAKQSNFFDHPAYTIYRVQSYVGAPFSLNGRPYGILNFQDLEPHEPFTTEDLVFVQTLADYFGKAIEQFFHP